jgi:hypothetical protein
MRERVLWPRGRRVVDRAALAPRLTTLENKTVAFLWDHVFRGDEVFPVVERELARRFPGARFVRWDAFGSIYGADERATVAALPARLRALGVDAVVSAVGC